MSIKAKTKDSMMRSLLYLYGSQIKKFIEVKHPDYIIPLETKGALLVDEAFESINYSPSTSKIIYCRALDYLSEEEISKSRFLILDDSFVTGKSLKDMQDTLIRHNALKENIFLMSFINLSDSKNFHKDIYEKTTFINFDGQEKIDKSLIFQLLEKEIFNKKTPTIADHLVFDSFHVNYYKFLCLLDELSKTNRLLYYGKRGDFYAGSIILDDLYDNSWPTPSKIRFWYKPYEKIRFVPMAFPSSTDSIPEHLNIFYKKILSILSSHPQEKLNIQEGKDRVDAVSISIRMDMLKYLKPLFKKFDMKISFSAKQFMKRYYSAKNDEKLILLLKEYYNELIQQKLPIKEYFDNPIITYIPLAKQIIEKLKELYFRQYDETINRKDFTHKGFTLSELINQYSKNFSNNQIHAAIDYCCDNGYIVPFWKIVNDKIIRCLRTTEKEDPQKEEVICAFIIYSQKESCHAWFIDKSLAIIKNTKKSISFSDIIAVTKGPFGDFCKIRMADDSYKLWKELDSDFWEIEESKKQNEEYVLFKQKQKWRDNMSWMSDKRTQEYKMPIQAISFLLEQGKYRSGVLLDILTNSHGGLDYISYNLEQIINCLSSRDLDKYKYEIKKHIKGVHQKIDYLSKNEIILNPLQRKCSRLNAIPLLKEEALDIVNKAKSGIFVNDTLYKVCIDISLKIIELADAKLNKDTKTVDEIMKFFKLITNEKDTQMIFKGIIKWLYALSARECESEKNYKINLFKEEYNQDYWILCFDIKNDAWKESENISLICKSLKSMARNWIIALNGKLTRYEVNSGDSEYGIFKNPIDAIQCGCWMSYHSEQLSYTNHFFPKKGAFGIALARGHLNFKDFDGVSGTPLNILGHFLKRKIDEISGDAGRERSENFKISNVHVLNLYDFMNIKNIPTKGNELTIFDQGNKEKSIKVSPLDVEKFIIEWETPWSHRLKKFQE